MITDLETLLNTNEFQKLVDAINGNKDFSFNQNGLTINSKSTDNSLHLTIKYDADKSEEQIVCKEREAFLNTLNTIEDNVFVEICEGIDNDMLSKLQKLINSNKLESVRSAILKFKQEAREILKSKINLYKECLQKLEK